MAQAQIQFVRYFQLNSTDPVRGASVETARLALRRVKAHRGADNGRVHFVSPGSDGLLYVGFENEATAGVFQACLEQLGINLVSLTMLPPGLNIRPARKAAKSPLEEALELLLGEPRRCS